MATNKLTWQNLRKAVTEYANCSEQEAERFLNALLESVVEGLKTDKQVKIKGLGVFSLKAVAPRKSVNIATGEDFTIEGYNKLTFSAESLLKESVEKRIQKPATEEITKEMANDPIKKLGEQANEIVDILAQLGQYPEEKKNENVVTVEESTPTKDDSEDQEATKEVTKEVTEEVTKEVTEEVITTPKKKKCKHAWICWLISGLLLMGIIGTGVYFREAIIGWWQCTKIMDRPIKKSKYHDIVVSKTNPKKSAQLEENSFWDDCIEKCSDWYEECSDVVVGWWKNIKFGDDQIENSKAAKALTSHTTYPTQEYQPTYTDFEDLEYASAPGIHTQYALDEISEDTEGMASMIADEEGITVYEEMAEQYEEVTNTIVALASQPREYTQFIGSETVDQDSRLAWIAYKYYGHKDLWVFIYEANRDVITNPAKIAPGQVLRIPALDAKYLDMNNSELQELVKNLSQKYL